MSRISNLIEELKRRNIVKVATAYAVGSFVVLQLCDILFPAIGISDAAIGNVLIALIIGFPLTIAIAWMFEITPDGIQRTSSVASDESISHLTGRRINTVIIGLLSVALVFFAYQYFKPAPPDELTEEQFIPIENNNVVAEANIDSRPSIAVLPFANMSSDEENEHFADGLTEEMLNLLAQTPGLRVTGRTSSFFYKGKNENLTTIGQALNVDNILEGSVRKSGNTVRITAQLVSAIDGFHLWSKTYDRDLTDIFAVQDEIAAEVTRAMQVTLLADRIMVAESRTSNPEAHDLYLRAKSELYKRRLESIRLAIDLYKQVITLDPEFAPPLVELATAYMIIYNNHSIGSFDEMNGLAFEALEKAKNLGYTNSDYYAALGLYHEHMADINASHIQLSKDAFEKAIELNENNVNAYIWYASLLTQHTLEEDRFARSEQLISKAITLDPLNRVANGNYAGDLAALGRDEEAEAHIRRLVRIDPDYPAYPALLQQVFLSQYRMVEAAEQLRNIQDTSRAKIFQVLNILLVFGEDARFGDYADTIPLENPMYDVAQEIVQAALSTPPELRAKAEVFLLKPDPDYYAQAYVFALKENRDFDLVRQLLENAYPDLQDAKNDERAVILNGSVDYMLALYHLGETARARRLARIFIESTETLSYTGMINRTILHAYCYMVLGEHERAITDIEAAYEEGWLGFYQNDVDKDPIFETIANDPRIVTVQNKVRVALDQQRTEVFKELLNQGILTSI